MQKVQTRALRIIGLSETEAADKYGITSIAEFILNNNVTIIRRILTDQHHPLTIKLTRTHLRETRTAFRFEARTDAYNNSVVPLCVRTIRDGDPALYNPAAAKKLAAKLRYKRAAARKKVGTSSPRVIKPKTSCQYCSKSYVGIKIH